MNKRNEIKEANQKMVYKEIRDFIVFAGAQNEQRLKPVPMEVDQVVGKSGDGSGDGSGDLGDEIDAVTGAIKCYNCGGAGHISRNCPTPSKGKGKGKGGGKGGWGREKQFCECPFGRKVGGKGRIERRVEGLWEEPSVQGSRQSKERWLGVSGDLLELREGGA